jgi:hypothetical protein
MIEINRNVLENAGHEPLRKATTLAFDLAKKEGRGIRLVHDPDHKRPGSFMFDHSDPDTNYVITVKAQLGDPLAIAHWCHELSHLLVRYAGCNLVLEPQPDSLQPPAWLGEQYYSALSSFGSHFSVHYLLSEMGINNIHLDNYLVCDLETKKLSFREHWYDFELNDWDVSMAIMLVQYQKLEFLGLPGLDTQRFEIALGRFSKEITKIAGEITDALGNWDPFDDSGILDRASLIDQTVSGHLGGSFFSTYPANQSPKIITLQQLRDSVAE